MGKFFAGILLAVVVIAILAYFGFINFGFGGKGEGNAEKSSSSITQEVKQTEKKEEVLVKVEVKKDLYLIDGKEVTLSQIKEKVTDSEKQAKVVIINNYASTKAWDELKAAFTEWEIHAVEE